MKHSIFDLYRKVPMVQYRGSQKEALAAAAMDPTWDADTTAAFHALRERLSGWIQLLDSSIGAAVYQVGPTKVYMREYQYGWAIGAEPADQV